MIAWACRPLSDEEQRLNVQKAISCIEQKKEVIVFQNSANKQVEKTFLFDKVSDCFLIHSLFCSRQQGCPISLLIFWLTFCQVFGPKAQQRSIYDYAISPFVKDVLEGYNCTVFAYGQTGTGKTYTMEGEMKFKVCDNSLNWYCFSCKWPLNHWWLMYLLFAPGWRLLWRCWCYP